MKVLAQPSLYQRGQTLIPLADRDSSTPLVIALLGTDVEYQVDQTQSTRFKVSVLDQNKGKTYSEVELDTKTLKTDASYLESSSCFETLKPYENYMPIHKKKLVSNLQNFSEVLYAQVAEDSWEKHEEAAASYANLKHEIEGFDDGTYKANKNTDAALRNYQQILNLFKTEAYTKNSTNLTKLLTLMKTFNFLGLKSIVDSLKAVVDAQNDHLSKWAESSASLAWSVGPQITRIENTQAHIHSYIASPKQDTSEIKNMMTEIFCAFKGQSTPSSSVPTTTLALTKCPITVRGRVQLTLPPSLLLKKLLILRGESLRNKEEKLEKDEREAKLLEMNKSELIKKIQDAKIKVMNREHSEKIKSTRELRKKRIDQYRWTTNNRLNPDTITNIYIRPNIKPVVITVYRGDQRNSEVHNPFKFSNFRVTKLDKLGPIIQKKKNKVVGELMTSWERGYEDKEIEASTSITENPVKRLQTEDDLIGEEKKQYDADIKAMNLILLGILNDIYNYVDTCKDA
ncbi:hypothetical protein Tco_1355318 [Tanacetum coccineum]